MGFGLFYYDLKTKEFTSIQSRTSLINEWIGCLHYSDDNKLYVGTYDGINCIDLDSLIFKVIRYSHKMLFIQSLKMTKELSGWAVPKDYPVGIKIRKN